jgi:hypothetical protein
MKRSPLGSAIRKAGRMERLICLNYEKQDGRWQLIDSYMSHRVAMRTGKQILKCPNHGPEPHLEHVRQIQVALGESKHDGGSIYEICNDNSFQVEFVVKKRKPKHSG